MAAPWRPEAELADFAAEQFDVEGRATEILKEGNISSEVARLSSALTSLDLTIQTHVSAHYTDLLDHALASSELEQSLAVMGSHVDSLQLSTDRLRARVREPYDKIAAGTLCLARLQETADLLRRTIRVLQLSKRLAAAMAAGESELGKAATSLAELADLLQADLAGLEVVEGEARRVRQWRVEVERQGEQLLSRGLATGNLAQLATGLQVFYNLGTLPAVVESVLAELQDKLRVAWVEGLDIKRISEKGEGVEGRGKTPGRAALPAGNMAAFRATLWTNMDALLEAVHGHMVKVHHLQRLLCKKVDPLTHQPYISCLADPSLVAAAWVRTTVMAAETLAAAVGKSNFVKQTLEAEYHKLVRLYTELWAKLRHAATQYGPGPQQLLEGGARALTDPFAEASMGAGLRASLTALEQAYLARSLARLFDPVNLMFSGSGAPSKEEVANMFGVMATELTTALVESRLLDAVTRNVTKTVTLFCVKSEGCVDSEASQVIGSPTKAQLQNVVVVNRLAEFKAGLEGLAGQQAAAVGQERVELLLAAAGEVERQMEAATEPLLASVGDSVEAILLTMHKEEFGGEVEATTTPAAACSLYMRELQAFMERIAKDFLSTFTCAQFLARQLQPLAEATIQRFVLQGSLVRPLGPAGALRLASDCAQLEFGLSSILGPSGHSALGPTGLTALGGSYRLLRAFRAILFLPPEDVAAFPGLGTTLPHSTALHLLISRCPAALPSPHTSLSWSLARYSAWLEDHRGERERLQLIQGALEAYVAAARQRQDKTFVAEYPVLCRILQEGVAQH